MRMRVCIYVIASCVLLLAACRTDEVIIPAEYEALGVEANPAANPVGMYVLNEGNMGSNKATIDYVDFAAATYARNIYAEANPTVVKELGDVGNDLQVYGSKLYAVINCSHKVEVMEARTLVRIGQVDIPNCRFIRFADGNAYVSAYVGPAAIDPDAQPGAVYRVDTATLAVTGEVTVGYQPEELVIAGDYIYVANSGGYRAPDYDNTLSVIDRRTMRQVTKITVAKNLHRVRQDAYGKLWVSSRGDYSHTPGRLYVLEATGTSPYMEVTDSLDVACSDLCIAGDSLYFISASWSNKQEANIVSYGVVDVRSRSLVSDHFITDGTESTITVPYGIAVNPQNGDIYVTDAKNYVSSGTLSCYSREGVRRWRVRTGDIPAHMTFIYL